VRQRDLQQTSAVARLLDHHDRAATNEDQRERADEFGDEVPFHGRCEMGDGRSGMVPGANLPPSDHRRHHPHLASGLWPLASGLVPSHDERRIDPPEPERVRDDRLRLGGAAGADHVVQVARRVRRGQVDRGRQPAAAERQ